MNIYLTQGYEKLIYIFTGIEEEYLYIYILTRFIYMYMDTKNTLYLSCGSIHPQQWKKNESPVLNVILPRLHLNRKIPRIMING